MSTTSMTETAESSPPKKGKWKNYLLILLILIGGAQFGYLKWVQADHAETLSNQESDLNEKARLALRENTANLLKASLKPLAWLVLNEYENESLAEMDGHFIQMVKEPGFEQISLVDHGNGMVVLSTNKKSEGSLYSYTFPIEATTSNEVVANSLPNGNFRFGVPVLNGKNRLATLVVEFKPAPYGFAAKVVSEE